MITGTSASPTGLSSDDGAASVSTLRASIPSADEAYELLVPAGATAPKAFSIAWESAFEAGRTDLEVRLWQSIDADDFAPVPSDLIEAVERIARAARNRDMWKAQCERQAEALAARFSVTDEMERAGVKHALSDTVHGSNGGWGGYVRRLWGAMNGARLAQGAPTRSAETTGSVGEADGGPVLEEDAPNPSPDTKTNKLIKALERIAYDLIEQQNEPWTEGNGLSHNRIHYWRDKAIGGSQAIRTALASYRGEGA